MTRRAFETCRNLAYTLIPTFGTRLFGSPETQQHCPRYVCEVARHSNSSEPALGAELLPCGAFGGAGGLVVPGGVDCEFSLYFSGGGVDGGDVEVLDED